MIGGRDEGWEGALRMAEEGQANVSLFIASRGAFGSVGGRFGVHDQSRDR